MNAIKSQIHILAQQGITEIKKLLIENGDIYDLTGMDIIWTAVYMGIDGNAYNSMYDNICVGNGSSLYIDLADGVTLYEDDLTTNHILDILSIIEEKKW